MRYIDNHLDTGERVICDAWISKPAYVTATLFMLVTMWPARLLGLLGTELALTDKRVLGTTGFLKKTRMSLPFTHLQNVSVQQGVLGTVFDYGHVTFHDLAGRKYLFRGIAIPLDIQQQTNEALEKAFLGRTLGQFVNKEKAP